MTPGPLHARGRKFSGIDRIVTDRVTLTTLCASGFRRRGRVFAVPVCEAILSGEAPPPAVWAVRHAAGDRSHVGKGRDFYKILGVGRSASADEIKRAYRRLAKEYHPDRNSDPSAEAKFKEVQEAYSVLSDSKKREEYDRFGEAAVGHWQNGPGGQRVYEWGGGTRINGDDLEDLFSAFGGGTGPKASVFDQFFGGRRAQPGPQRGGDQEHRMPLSFDQIVHGAVVSVAIKSESGGRNETLDVKIPPGVEDGQRIRLAGKGHPGRHGGPPGDFFLVCQVPEHPYFRRKGADVYVDVPVGIAEAALGASIDVPAVDGCATVKLPPGTPSGAKLRLSERGLQKRGGAGRGDAYVVIKIVPPVELTETQQMLITQLSETELPDPRASCPWNQGASK